MNTLTLQCGKQKKAKMISRGYYWVCPNCKLDNYLGEEGILIHIPKEIQCSFCENVFETEDI